MEDGPNVKNVVSDPQTLWKDATIPYIIEPTFSKFLRSESAVWVDSLLDARVERHSMHAI